MTFLALFMMKTNKSCNPGTKINKFLFNNIPGISVGKKKDIFSLKYKI
jgi:hypothetical protein